MLEKERIIDKIQWRCLIGSYTTAPVAKKYLDPSHFKLIFLFCFYHEGFNE